MRWSDVTSRPTERKLREFAGVAFTVLMMLAIWRMFSSGSMSLAAVFATAAVGVGVIGLTRPRWLGWVFAVWMAVAFPIAWLTSHFLLAIVFFGLITPLSLVFRLWGRDVLDRAWPGKQDSYWRDKPVADRLTRYLRQF